MDEIGVEKGTEVDGDEVFEQEDGEVYVEGSGSRKIVCGRGLSEGKDDLF